MILKTMDHEKMFTISLDFICMIICEMISGSLNEI